MLLRIGGENAMLLEAGRTKPLFCKTKGSPTLSVTVSLAATFFLLSLFQRRQNL
jgi:hypothetical protein